GKDYFTRLSSLLVFFFQAEDGIRDGHVTGVQTCALPIFGRIPWSAKPAIQGVDRLPACGGADASGVEHRTRASGDIHRARGAGRSEERRVGKECRSRWTPDREKKDE